MEKVSLFIHDINESVIMESKKILIRRITQLLDDHFDGALKFAPDEWIRLDKYDMELGITTPTYFRPSSLVIDGAKRRDSQSENAVLSYCEADFESFEQAKARYRWCDNLKDLTLSDIQTLLYLVEKEINKMISSSC